MKRFITICSEQSGNEGPAGEIFFDAPEPATAEGIRSFLRCLLSKAEAEQLEIEPSEPRAIKVEPTPGRGRGRRKVEDVASPVVVKM